MERVEMPRGRTKKHRDPYDGYEALDPKAWLPELVKETRGRPKSIERMTAKELAAMEVRVKRARIIKENHHKDMLRSAITKMVKESGFDVKDVLR
jgi:hypothetical protein